jgi:Fic family protein
MAFNPKKPFNELPLLPPKSEIDTKAILLKTITASRVLSKLNGSIKKIPNPTILLNSLVLQEAKSSSEIENILTTNDALFQALGSNIEKIDESTKEVLHYQEALWHGYNELRKRPFLSTKLFINLVQVIKQIDYGIRKVPGTRIVNSLGESIYTPPEGEELILKKLKNLETYLNEDTGDIDPLIRLAVQHYQFEAIHPFYDGNGRTGRIINILYLVNQDLLELPILYLSKYIIENKNDYYKKLNAVTKHGDWEPWILYILDAVEETSKHSLERINAIADSIDECTEKIKKQLPKIYSKDLVEALFLQPYCRIKTITEAGIAKRETAREYLSQIEALGILESRKIGKEILFINKKFFNLIKN